MTTFDATWTAPNGLAVVVKTFNLYTATPTSTSSPKSQIQLVGVYRTDSPPVKLAGQGWSDVATQILDTNDVLCNGNQSVARANFLLSGGGIFYYFDTPSSQLPLQVNWPSTQYTPAQVAAQVAGKASPVPANSGLPVYVAGVPQNINATPSYPISLWGGMYSRSLSKMGTDAQSQAEIAAYQWGLQKLASGPTLSQVAGAPTTTPTIATNVVPKVTTPAPVASNTLLYAGIGVAAIGGYFLLK
jgi:hypothetical protein